MCLKGGNGRRWPQRGIRLRAQDVGVGAGPNENGVLSLNNKQFFPFERNRYYVGKLLTSADFQAEQTYMGNKRRFLNEMLFGEGVVCGLGVYALDDVSLMIESGVALDSMGRELVLDRSVVRKLSAIDGFEALESDRVSLCLRYEEKPEQPVYTVNRRDQEEYEMNRLREGVSFLLLDADKTALPVQPENEFFSRMQLYADADYAVELSIPAFIPCGSRVRMTLTVTKQSDRTLPFSMECVLQSSALTAEDETHETKITVVDAMLAEGERIVRQVWLTAQQRPAQDSVIIAEPGRVDIRLAGQRVQISEKMTVRAVIEQTDAEAIIERELGRVSLENREMAAGDTYIRLAELKLQRTQNNCMIESVQESGVKQYVRTNVGEAQRRMLRTYYGSQDAAPVIVHTAEPTEQTEHMPAAPREPLFATGLCEIPLNREAKPGRVFYSDEIMHGLGKGDVFVSLGFEYLSEDPKTNQMSRSIIYGNTDLFADEQTPVPKAELAIKVMSDRGSFMVAAKMLEETTNALLMLRWMAYKIPAAGDKLESDLKGKRIAAMPPTIVMGTRDSRYFNVRFHNMEPCTLTYTLTEKGSGEITTDGVYTAPAREGVYEIRIACTDDPLISTYAYAVVKKNTESEDEQSEEK